MNKGITVKKCKSHRYAIRFFAVLFAAFPIILSAQQALFALAGSIPFLLLVPLVLYYETWQIIFTEKEIKKSVFRNKRTYAYTQIQQVIKGYYSSERDTVIHIKFLDGTAIQFRKSDENAKKAEKELQKHCSIKTV